MTTSGSKGGKPSHGTPADRRLSRNKPSGGAKKPTTAKPAAPKKSPKK